jgi:hypothetical protein
MGPFRGGAIMPETKMTQLQRQCLNCKTVKVFVLEEDKVKLWMFAGAKIQDVFPELSAGDREMLISSFCSECFDKLFAEDE